ICDSDCRILNVNAKYGGATHDAFIWENSVVNNYMQSLHRNNEQVWLLGNILLITFTNIQTKFNLF
ncbi:transposase family protein, partial [Pseudomonas aeruginosa]